MRSAVAKKIEKYGSFMHCIGEEEHAEHRKLSSRSLIRASECYWPLPMIKVVKLAWSAWKHKAWLKCDQ
jgi:hypothetical protein